MAVYIGDDRGFNVNKGWELFLYKGLYPNISEPDCI